MNKTTLYINSGICKCGHSWDAHHLSMICNKAAWDAIVAYITANFPGRRWIDSSTGQEMLYPMYIPGECEAYGFNECGGMKYNEATDAWEEHCHGYNDKDGPLGEVEWG